MSSLTYETVAQFAQQAGLFYFVAVFGAALVHAFQPKHNEAFKRLAHLPLEKDETDDV